MENKRRCKKCGSSQVYVRLKTKELVCKTCGYVVKLEDLESGV